MGREGGRRREGGGREEGGRRRREEGEREGGERGREEGKREGGRREGGRRGMERSQCTYMYIHCMYCTVFTQTPLTCLTDH